jgi:PAS domain S-box-containing protein
MDELKSAPTLVDVNGTAHPISVLWHVHPDLLCTMDMAGRLRSCNPAWSNLLGWTETEILTTPVWEMIHPDDIERTTDETSVIFDGHPTVRFANRWRHKNGRYRWISWVGIAEDGLMFCSGRDITEEKQKEEDLAARTSERNRLWTLSQDMFARANLDGMMSAVSPAWKSVLGWSESELLTRPYATFMHQDDMARTLEALAHMGETGEPTRFENRIATIDGNWKWIEWTVAPEMEGQNFIAVGRDLSEVKAREAELVTAQESLRQAQKMEAVGQLTGGLAHDFNNLIAGISGSLEIMGNRLAQGRISELDRYITAASGAARRAAGLTQRLLAFSRRQTLDPKVTDVNKLVQGMLDLIHRSVGPEISVQMAGQPDLWSSFVDGGQLENALLNLCINARDAMPSGGTITIETSNCTLGGQAAKEWGLSPGEYILLNVSDRGIGMTAETISRAFDPFYTTKPIGKGTGLGLSMVYGFAGQSGGTVRIASEVGKGTTISIYLPGQEGAEKDEELEVQEGPANFGHKHTVLLVDDEPLIRMVAVEALEELGYRVIEAEDAASALKILNSGCALDLLITDVGLPNGLNGRQLADAARDIRRDMGVLFITGYAENAVLNHGHLGPGMRIITKPFQIESFVTLVGEMVQNPR